MQLAGMASNHGRNLMHIADRAPGDATFAVLLSDDSEAPVLEAAAERGIPTEVVPRRSGTDREEHESRVLEVFDRHQIDLVCLDRYSHILSGRFLEAVPTVLNVHPSLLPTFQGQDAHEQALDRGVRVTGCTVHVVTEAVQDGPIVTQEAVPVYEQDEVTDVATRVRDEGEFKAYPRAVRWFAEDRVAVDRAAGTVAVAGDDGGRFPLRRMGSDDRARALRYGENPHQDAALFADHTCTEASVVHAEQRNEGAKALSYNNYNDADAALNLVKEFDQPAAAVIKHTNPAGCAVADSTAAAYDKALATDPLSAFGGIVALNRECDAPTAEHITESFKEVVVARGYTDAALERLRTEENLRVLETGSLAEVTEHLTEKPLTGGRLVQDRDRQRLKAADLETVTDRKPTADQVETMLFAWQTIKHVKSNSIVFATGTETVGIGMGQVSRVDAVRLAAMKADEHAEGKTAAGAVMASDAFFPFPDGIEAAADAGIEAVIQPGGSVKDDAVIAAANDHDMAMVFTGQRAFRHD